MLSGTPKFGEKENRFATSLRNFAAYDFLEDQNDLS